MTIFRDLAVSESELATKFIADLVTASGGAMSASGNVASIDNKVFVRANFDGTSTYQEDEQIKTQMNSPFIEIGGAHEGVTSYTRVLGNNDSAHSLAYEITSMASGDVLVKFAQWVSLEPLDIMAESFQAWGIAAYSVSGSSDNFLSGEQLLGNDLLSGMNFGGFLLHQMKTSGAYGITVFEKDTGAPIFTWLPDGPKSMDTSSNISYIAEHGGANYVEKKRRFKDSNDKEGYYRLLIQEPYAYPKTGAYVQYAVLAPIFSPSTTGDYSKTARRLIQAPHMYNPFDSDGFLLIDGGEKGAFYCDHGICLSAKGEAIADTGNQRPSPNPWLHYQLGYYPHDTTVQTNYGVYGLKTIDY